jgi:copper chaperone CopZ
MQTEVLNVTGMTSENCVDSVTRAIQTIKGVSNVSVSSNGRATVQYDEDLTATQEMATVLTKAGYGVRKVNLEESCGGGCCGGCGGSK